MNAQDRLHAARLGTLEGKYAESLAEYIWFHHHALAEQPSLYGVRLTFALSYWKELADIYPPALKALLELRDEKTQRLVDGQRDWELFHDVEAMNQYLGAAASTANLLELLDRAAPEFARECSNMALEALVEAGKFDLAAKYLPDPANRTAMLAESLNGDVARIPERPRSKSPRYRAYTRNFARELCTIIAILNGAGRASEAASCRSRAIAILKPWYVRKAVEASLASNA
jgi:hypothetical protein